jgi:hypothetical protein
VAKLWRELFYCGAKEFNCGGAATLNGPWRTLLYEDAHPAFAFYIKLDALRQNWIFIYFTFPSPTGLYNSIVRKPKNKKMLA